MNLESESFVWSILEVPTCRRDVPFVLPRTLLPDLFNMIFGGEFFKDTGVGTAG
jgi:hypothetical protein